MSPRFTPGPYEPLPPEALARDGTCSQCGRVAEVVHAVLMLNGVRVGRIPCGACLTDLAAGCDVLSPSAEVYVETKDGSFKAVAYDAAKDPLRVRHSPDKSEP